MQLRRKVVTGFNRVLDVLFMLSTAVLALISVTILIEVVTRTFFERPIAGTTEITGYCLASVTFLGTAWLLKDGGHVKMDLILSRLKPGAQSILNSATSAVGAITCGIVTWYAARATLYSLITNELITTQTLLILPPIISPNIISESYFLTIATILSKSVAIPQIIATNQTIIH